MMASMISGPESVDQTLAGAIYKLDSVTKCLEESLNEFTEEQHSNDDNDDSNSTIKIHKNFQNKLLNKYGESMVQAYHYTERGGNGEHRLLDETRRKNKKNDKLTVADQNETEAPAALLTGTLKHYNRYEGNWRIVISDASIRPRINIPYTDTTDVEARKRTLYDHSAIETERQLKRAKSNEQQTTNHQLLPSVNEDGSIKLNGDIVILAYDDYVISNHKSE
jgi:hypothetical protein